MPLWRALGLVQHHDIITGDGYDNVMEDNAGRIRNGVSSAGAVLSSAIDSLLLSPGSPASGAVLCFNASQSPCPTIADTLNSFTPVRYLEGVHRGLPARLTCSGCDVCASVCLRRYTRPVSQCTTRPPGLE